MIARMIPCSTPQATTVTAVTAAIANSITWPERRIFLMPTMSTSSMPIRNTTDASTQFGRYWSGFGQEEQDDQRRRPRWSGRRAACARRRCRRSAVFVGLPLTTNVPVRPAPMFADPEADHVRVLVERAPRSGRAYAREVAALWARMTMKIETAVATSCATSPNGTLGQQTSGSPPGTVPRSETPCEARSKPQLTDDRADDGDQRARDLLVDHPQPTIVDDHAGRDERPSRRSRRGCSRAR